MSSATSLSKAISFIPASARVFVHGGSATPNALLAEVVQQAERFEELTFVHLHTEGPATYAEDRFKKNFRIINLFVGSNMRKFLNYDQNDYLPCFISELPNLIRSKKIQIDVALIHVSPPDANGYCSLGTSVDIAKAAVQTAAIIIAQINPCMPRVHGDGFIHISQITASVFVDVALPETKVLPNSETEVAIGKNVASLIEDRSTLQLGIGAIPNAVARQLTNHKDLGIHSEMWSDGVMDLIKCGAVTNAFKKVYRGKSVSGFLVGSLDLYQFVNDNPSILQLEIDYVNNPNVICRNPKVAAVNSAVEIDFTGQVCADSIGAKIISGVGGQMDFMRGATLSEGGKPIIALPSRTKDGRPRIVAQLKPGAGVVTTRSHVHYVVTEYGVAQLNGKTLSERVKSMIAIAHPNDREHLSRSFFEIFC